MLSLATFTENKARLWSEEAEPIFCICAPALESVGRKRQRGVTGWGFVVLSHLGGAATCEAKNVWVRTEVMVQNGPFSIGAPASPREGADASVFPRPVVSQGNAERR